MAVHTADDGLISDTLCLPFLKTLSIQGTFEPVTSLRSRRIDASLFSCILTRFISRVGQCHLINGNNAVQYIYINGHSSSRSYPSLVRSEHHWTLQNWRSSALQSFVEKTSVFVNYLRITCRSLRPGKVTKVIDASLEVAILRLTSVYYHFFKQRERAQRLATQSRGEYSRSQCSTRWCIVLIGDWLDDDIPALLMLMSMIRQFGNRRLVVFSYTLV